MKTRLRNSQNNDGLTIKDLQEASRTESWLVADILAARATLFNTPLKNSAVLVLST